MSLKRYFEDKSNRSTKLITDKSSESLLKEDEFSHNFVISREKVLKRFIPRIDYSKPENFAYFGNAERYYEDSIKRIYQTYPYDDSPQEKEDWFLSSSFIDLYVYNSKYPKSTGYVVFSPSGWSAAASTADGYGNPATKEYIYVKGGPHVGNVYDESQNKESNLKLDGDKGNTVEFYLKKSEFVNSLTQKEVIFDCATNDSDISAFGSSYGRFRVELDGNAGGSPFLVTYSSGSNGASSVVVGSNITKATIADDKWHHYAVSVHNTGSNLEINLYIDGKLNHSVRSGTTCAGNKVNMNANVGALVTSVSNGSSTGIGWGKLSGSLDEFRFWKIKRTGEQIGDNWRTQVPGGTSHKDISGNLGVYYKFNEGITTNDDTDKVVLDYSGRVSNGNWIGYSNAARNTGSAIKQSGANVIEFEDPIIRSNHPSVVALLEELKDIGRNHDILNSSALFSTFPSWMIQDDADPYKGDSKLAELVQIISSYFDTLYMQTKVLPGLKSKGYSDYSSPQHLSGSKPSPFSDKLLRSSGFIAPDLFVESNVIERILSKDAGREYEQDLSDVKNLIYKNIYNNIVHIYKTKGTEQSFRNIMRCFGIDDEIIKTNLYATGYTYNFSDTYQYKSEKVKGINFNHPDHFSATVFQQTSSYGNVHYMSGNADIYTPYTFESNVVFPLKVESGLKGYFNTTFTSASIFGLHTPSEAAGNTSFASNDSAGLQVYAVHHPSDQKAAKFVLKSSAGNVPTLVTKFFNDVYDDRHWILSVRIKPDAYPYSSQAVSFVKASGTITTTGNPSNNEEFTLTDAAGTSVTFIFKTGVATVDGTKSGGKVIIGVSGATGHAASVGDRMRAAITASDLKVTVVETSGGAMTLTQNFAGTSGNTAIDMSGVTTVTSTDFTGGRGSYTVNFTGYNYILDELQESFDLSGSASVADLGDFSPSRKAMYAGANRTNFNSTLQQSSDVIINSVRAWSGYLENEELKSHSLSFGEYGRIHPSRNEFLFQTGSNTTQISQISTLMLHWDFAQVTGSDSNGSFFVADTSRKPTGSFGPNNTALNTYHGGVGFGFPASSEKFVKGTVLPVAKEHLPENVLNSSLVTVEDRDKVRFTRDSRPINYYYSFEKSMYQTISEEMVKMFATIKEFNNLIGEPVNKYRKTYKSLDYLRSLFFSNVQADPDLDKYIEFYKWFDNSLGLMLEEVIPFSLPGSEGIKNMVESHILERNKYEHKAPTLEFKTKDPVFPIAGLRELLYDWEHGHAPLSNSQSDNCLWWKERAERGDLLSTNALVDANREKIRVRVNSDVSGSTYALRRFSRPYRFGVEVNRSYDVGSNIQTNKINNFYKSTIKFGSTSDAIELNASDLQDQEVCNDVFGSNQKERLSGKADTLGTTGYLDADIDMIMPFSLYSSSLDSQPLALFKDNVIMTNNHHDSYHVEGSVPLQGIFTSKHVGGKPHRDVDISVRTPEHRSEAYNLEVTANKIKLLHQPVDRPRSMFYKNEKVRRPVNIRNIRSETESFARATGTISTTGNPNNDEEFVLTDANGLSVTFIFKTGVATVDGSKSDGKVIIGVNGAAGHAPSVGDRIRAAISASDLDIDARETSGGSMILTQRTTGPAGNTKIDMSGVTTVTSTNFSGGAEFHKTGNYSEVYEYVLTNGRKENNSDFAANNGHTGSSFDSVLSLADGILDQKKISRAKNTHVIVGRFSSPGGTETMGDSDGGPNLDYAAAEYSVYNSLNHRNSLVRGAKNELDAEHSQRFGLRNSSSLVEGSYEIVSGSAHGFASSHKVQRNELTKYVVTSTVNFNTKAVLFDGTNDYLEIDETRTIYKNNNEFSVFAWIKHSAADTSFQHTIWSHHTSGGTNREIFGIKGTTTNNGVTAGTLFFYQEGHSWQSLSSTRVDDGEWHLVGFTYEGTSNSVRLFVDGVAQPGSITISNIAEQVNDSNDKVSIGQEWDSGSASDFFKGHMANLSIWSKQLSPNEVYEIYSDGQNLGPHQLTRHTAAKYLEAWYRMGDGDNGSGTDDSYNVAIYDMSKNSFHAVPTNLAADAIKDVESTLPGVLSIYTKGSAKDNKFVSHPIPRNEIQYSWITASSTDTRDSFIGHKHDFAVPRAIQSTYQKEISFLTSSVSSIAASGQNYHFISNFSRLNYIVEKVNPVGLESVQLATASIDLDTNTLTPSWHPGVWEDIDFIPFRHFLAGSSPYNNATWRQIRGGEHPIIRSHNKNNNISIHLRNGVPNSKPFMNYSRPHNINSNVTEVNDRVISNYQEPPVTSQYKPVRLLYGIVLEDRLGELREDALENGLNLETTKVRTFGPAKSEVEMHVTYGNAMCKFANRDLMDVLELEDIENTRFDDLLRNMREPEGPNDIAQPFGFVYAETIYPAEVNAYQKETRLRTAFVSKVWRETRELRLQPLTKSFSTPSNEESYDFYHNHPTETTTGQTNSQGLAIFDSGSAFGVLYLNQSRWPLDARSDFSDRPETLFTSSVSWEPNQVQGFRQRVYGELRDSGELQNGYSIFHHGPTATRDDIVTAAIYNRRIQQTAGNRTYLAGESKWEAGDQAGKYPFEKDYNAWAEDLKSAQDFSLLPEFRISEHIPSLLETGNISTPIENFLQLTGSSLSSQDNTFFKTYSNSDFMKYFSVIKESIEEMGQNPNSLFLKCSAMLKMLPYEGFYPATRTLKIAEIFQQEYTNHNFDATDISPDPSQNVINGYNSRVSTNSRTNLHLASKMLYAPGVLYNSIKSGVAVDYPIFSQNGDGKWDNNILVGLIEFSLTASNPSAVGTLWNTTEGPTNAKYGSLFTGSYVNDTHAADNSIPRIKGDEYRRVSFEDMLDPSNLAGMILYDNEPHPSASYGMFAFTNNQRGKELDCHPLYGTLFSGSTTGPDRASTGAVTPNHWGDSLPIASAGDTIKYSLAMHNFCAEVPNFFLKNRALTSIVSEPGPYFFNRDEIGQEFSMFVRLKNSDILMYDNPSAFGPPVDNTTGNNDSYGFDPYTPSFLKKNAQPFVELSFKPTKRKYTLDEIQGELTASFNIGNRATTQIRYSTNKSAQMTLSASINLFGRVDEPNIVADKDGNPFQVIDRDEPRSRWLIQTKWETPVLNFKDVDMTLFDPTGSAKAISLSEAFSEQSATPWSVTGRGHTSSYLTGSRGMWHQYGRLPTEQEGYFLQISDPSKFDNKRSLASKVGFPVGVSYRVGELAETKQISEAVVAIPYFISRDGDFDFFELGREDIREILGEFDALSALRGDVPLTPGVNPQIRHQIEMMQKYNFPPQLDFIRYRDKNPIAMYVFEFSYNLDKQDLADLWQNLPAKIGLRGEGFSEKTVGHKLVKNGQVLDPLSGEIKEKMQWMVFKVKKKAEINYFKKSEDSIFQSSGKEGNKLRDGKTQVLIDQLAQKFARLDGYSYNWPYDYFSLVELIKVDAEVTFRPNEER